MSWNIVEGFGKFILVLGGVDKSKLTGDVTFVLVDSPSRISPSLNV